MLIIKNKTTKIHALNCFLSFDKCQAAKVSTNDATQTCYFRLRVVAWLHPWMISSFWWITDRFYINVSWTSRPIKWDKDSQHFVFRYCHSLCSFTLLFPLFVQLYATTFSRLIPRPFQPPELFCVCLLLLRVFARFFFSHRDDGWCNLAGIWD